MNEFDWEAVKQRTNLVELVESYGAGLDKIVSGEPHGPCPICKTGDDRFFVRRDGMTWGCRGCGAGRTLSGDCFDLVSRIEGISVANAYMKLSGQTFTPYSQPSPVDKDAWKSEDWQADAEAGLARYQSALVACGAVPGGSPSWKYLQSRGITPQTMQAFGIGHCSRWTDGRPAVVIPWRLPSGKLCALKYRFIDDRARSDKTQRFSQKRGGRFFLLGSNLCAGAGTLLAVEGDINALTIYQLKDDRLDVVSFGSDSDGDGTKGLIDFLKARKYQRVFVWCDTPEKALGKVAALRNVGIAAAPMQSPGGKDANDLLVEMSAEALWQALVTFMELPSLTPLQVKAGSILTALHDSDARLYPPISDAIDQLQALISQGNPADGPKAVAIADQIAAWCKSVDTALEGSKLNDSIRTIFADSIKNPPTRASRCLP